VRAWRRTGACLRESHDRSYRHRRSRHGTHSYQNIALLMLLRRRDRDACRLRSRCATRADTLCSRGSNGLRLLRRINRLGLRLRRRHYGLRFRPVGTRSIGYSSWTVWHLFRRQIRRFVLLVSRLVTGGRWRRLTLVCRVSRLRGALRSRWHGTVCLLTPRGLLQQYRRRQNQDERRRMHPANADL